MTNNNLSKLVPDFIVFYNFFLKICWRLVSCAASYISPYRLHIFITKFFDGISFMEASYSLIKVFTSGTISSN